MTETFNYLLNFRKAVTFACFCSSAVSVFRTAQDTYSLKDFASSIISCRFHQLAQECSLLRSQTGLFKNVRGIN